MYSFHNPPKNPTNSYFEHSGPDYLCNVNSYLCFGHFIVLRRLTTTEPQTPLLVPGALLALAGRDEKGDGKGKERTGKREKRRKGEKTNSALVVGEYALSSMHLVF